MCTWGLQQKKSFESCAEEHISYLDIYSQPTHIPQRPYPFPHSSPPCPPQVLCWSGKAIATYPLSQSHALGSFVMAHRFVTLEGQRKSLVLTKGVLSIASGYVGRQPLTETIQKPREQEWWWQHGNFNMARDYRIFCFMQELMLYLYFNVVFE